MQQKNRRKILMVTEWYEPGFKAGGPIQACKNVVACLKEAYDFFILCSDRDHGDHVPYPGIPLNQWLENEPGVAIWYASSNFMRTGRIFRLLQEVKPDFVYFNSMYSYKYTLLPLWIILKNRFHGKIILAPRGMLHKGALEKKYLKKSVFLRLFLLIGWSRRIVFQATDEQEQMDIRHFFTGDVQVSVVEDIPTLNQNPWRGMEKTDGSLKCIFLSRIHPKKNLHYFLSLLQEINPAIQIAFDIYGSNDHPEYMERCEKIVTTLPPNIKVRFMGAITFNKVFETLRLYHVFILPTLGENYGHAIFEALTTGVPVIISDQTPWRNLETMKVGWDIPLLQKGKFVEAVEQAARWGQQEYDDWSERAYVYAREYMGHLNAMAKYGQLFFSPQRKVILLFTDWYEPGYKAGGPIQSCKNIVNMLEGEYDFYIICSDRDLGDKKPYDNIRMDEWTKTSDTTSIWYASPKFITGKSLKKIFEKIRPDYVYFNSMYSPLYTLLPLWVLLRNYYSGTIILAPRGMLHKGALKRKYFKKYVFLKLFRFIAWHKRVMFHATNKQEMMDILLFFSTKAKITVLDNIPNTTIQHWSSKPKKPGELRCIFISRIHPKKNLYFILKVLTEIRNDIKLVFDIYGMEEDKNYVQDCKQLLPLLGSNIQVEFKGPIPYDQVSATMQRYHLFVLPTLGENYGHVIYEALSVGDPVLISDQTPWRNLFKMKAGWDLALSEKDKFKSAIIEAASWNQEVYDEWSRNAATLAEKSVDIPRLYEKYMKLFG